MEKDQIHAIHWSYKNLKIWNTCALCVEKLQGHKEWPCYTLIQIKQSGGVFFFDFQGW